MQSKYRVAALIVWIAGLSTGEFSAVKAEPKDGRVELDVPYTAGGDQQKLDLYLPKKKGFATVVFTYGGGWHTGSRKSVTPIGEKLQSLGYGCALLSHRLGPKDRFPAQIEDVAAGFAWVKGHVAEKGGDANRVFLIGHSSGAHLSLLLASDPKYLAKHGLAPKDIAGVVGLSPPVDLAPRKDGKGFGDALMRGRGADVFSRDTSVMKDASPICHLSKDLPPVLLIVGERDFPMLEADARDFVERAKEHKAAAASFVTMGRDHLGVAWALLDDRSDVSEKVRTFLDQPGDSIQKEADEPAAKESALRKELLAMEQEDQEIRVAVVKALGEQGISLGEAKSITDPAQLKVFLEQSGKMAAVDQKDRERLKTIVDKHGWPGKSLVGKDGACRLAPGSTRGRRPGLPKALPGLDEGCPQRGGGGPGPRLPHRPGSCR
jgi:acetyl esterase/lipase